MQAIKSFSCCLAITRSSLFGLHWGRKTFQNSFYTWVTFSKMSNWNIKPHELLRKKMYKAKQSQDWKRLKLVNVRIEKRNVVLRVTSASEKHAFFFFFFLVYYTHVIVYWEHARRGSLEKNIIGKVLLSREFPFCLLWKSGVLLFC